MVPKQLRKRDPIRTLPPMTATLIRYARCSTDRQGPAAQRQALLELGVVEDRIYTDHGLTGTTRTRPGLDPALAAVRASDTLVVPKLDRPARSVPDARHRRPASGTRRETGPRPGPLRPGRSHGKAVLQYPRHLRRVRSRFHPHAHPRGHGHRPRPGEMRGKQPKLSDSSGNSAACMPRASIPSAISPNPAPSQDQPSIAHSTDATPLSVRSCPLPESTRTSRWRRRCAPAWSRSPASPTGRLQRHLGSHLDRKGHFPPPFPILYIESELKFNYALI